MKREHIINRQGKEYVLYQGLLDEAHSQGLKEIVTTIVQIPNDLNGHVAVVHAAVETAKGRFSGIGDADPGNVNRMMVNAIIRMAETRAKARALRDAINVGMVALEELPGDDDAPPPDRRADPPRQERRDPPAPERPAARPLPATPPKPAAAPAPSAPRQTEPVRLSFGMPDDDERPGGGPSAATPKQLVTIQRMARAAGKTIDTEGMTRRQASDTITQLIGEMEQARA